MLAVAIMDQQQLAERLRDYIKHCCSQVRKNLSTSQTPTDLEIAQFLHGFVGGLHGILDRAAAATSPGTASSSSSQNNRAPVVGAADAVFSVSVSSVRRQLARPFDGLYDFHKNSVLKLSGSSSSGGPPGGGSAGAPVADGEEDVVMGNDSCSEDCSDHDDDEERCLREDHAPSETTHQRFTVQHFVFILNALENLFCSGNQVLHRLAAEDIHAAVRRRISEKRFASHLVALGKKEWRSAVRFDQDVCSLRVSFEAVTHPDHHVLKWAFELANDRHEGECLFFCDGFRYKRED